MALPNPAPGDPIAAADIDAIRNHLEGAAGSTAAYLFRQLSGNFGIRLSTADGSTKVSIQDSAGVEVASIDSDGNLIATANTFTTLNLPTSASPAPTVEGRVIWDSDDDNLTVGDGATTKTFVDRNKGWSWVAKDTTERTNQVVASTAMVTFSGLSIPATTPILIRGLCRKDAGGAYKAALGLTINSTVVLTPAAGSTAGVILSASNQVEEGWFEWYIPPRVTGYLSSSTLTAETGLKTADPTRYSRRALTADAPTATVTTLVITGSVENAALTMAVDEVHVYTLGV